MSTRGTLLLRLGLRMTLQDGHSDLGFSHAQNRRVQGIILLGSFIVSGLHEAISPC